MKLLPETRERIDRNLRGEGTAVPVLAQINEHVATLCGGNLEAYYTNAASFVEMNLAVFEYYALDLPAFFYDLYNIEAEALGQAMNWMPDRMPDVDRANPLIREHADLDRLQPPDFRTSGRMPYVLELSRRCQDLGLPPRLRYCSPFSLAANVRGIENLIMDIMTDPAFAHRMLTFLTDEVLIPWVQTQREAIGEPEAVGTGADAVASPPIVTVEILEEFVMPYVARMNERIGPVTSIGYWGYSRLFRKPEKFHRMLELMASVGPGFLQCLDPDVAAIGPEPYVEFARSRKMPLMLGLDTHLLQDGPVDTLVERCREYVLAGAKADGLIMFLNDISVKTSPQNVHAAIAAIRHFGTYPIVDRPATTFQVPECEPFDSFMERYSAAIRSAC
jgi:uroporphyrinogen-III decarboxylase